MPRSADRRFRSFKAIMGQAERSLSRHQRTRRRTGVRLLLAGFEPLERRELLSVTPAVENLQLTGVGTMTATEGTALSAPLATFSDPNGIPPGTSPSSYYSTPIDWGDGTTSTLIAGTVSVNVTEPAISAAGTGAATTSLTATFTDGKHDAMDNGLSYCDSDLMYCLKTTPESFTATINWGDGTTTKGTVSTDGSSFQVFGSHVYRGTLGIVEQKETDVITVTVRDESGNSLTMTANRPTSSDSTGGNVEAVVESLLGRPDDESASSYLATAVTKDKTLDDVAASIAGSDEFYVSQVIQPVYEQVLGRAATADEVQALLQESPRMGVMELKGHIEAGQLTLTRPMTGENSRWEAWIDKVFEDDLGYAADKPAISYYSLQLQDGISAFQVAMEIADSKESTTL